MKFAAFSKFLVLALTAGVLALSGCGATSSGNNLALTPGNWSMTVTSSGAAGTFYIGGNLTQTGTTLAGTLQFIGSAGCFPPSAPVDFTGIVNGKNVTLTSANVAGQVLTITASGTAGTALTGTYSVTGGCQGGDHGTVTANAVSSVSGTWKGTIVDANSETVTVLMTLTEAATASADGSFALTGNLTYTGSTCSVSGTLPAGSAFVAGTSIAMQGNTVESDNSAGNFTYYPFLNTAASPTSMQGPYTQTFGVCTDQNSNPATFTKQ